jgi:hypothetical protein
MPQKGPADDREFSSVPPQPDVAGMQLTAASQRTHNTQHKTHAKKTQAREPHLKHMPGPSIAAKTLLLLACKEAEGSKPAHTP